MDAYYLQLYSVRDALDADYKGTLKQVADMGYEGVEFAGNYGGMDGDALAKELDYLGLSAISAHISLDELENNFDYHKNILSACGCRYMICPWADMKTEQDALALAKRLDVLAERCAQNGFIFGYHNHAHEFEKAENGEYLYDILMQSCSPLVLAELDICWLKYADVDIEQQLRKYAGRLDLLHLKQLDIVNGEKRISSLDKGIIDFEPVIKTGKLLGTEYFIVEQDSPVEQTPMADMKNSIDFLKALKV